MLFKASYLSSTLAVFTALSAFAAPPPGITRARDTLRTKNCAAFLRALKSPAFSPLEKTQLTVRIESLRERASTVLNTDTSRRAFDHALNRFGSFIAGSRPSQTPVDVKRDLKRLQRWLTALLVHPKRTPLLGERAFSQEVLFRIQQSLQREKITADQWSYLAIDAVRALTVLLQPSTRVDRPERMLQSFLGDRIENILMPVFLTTEKLTMQDFNETAVISSILGGIVPDMVYSDGLTLEDNPREFLLEHDLLTHGTELRRRQWATLKPQLHLWGYSPNFACFQLEPLPAEESGGISYFSAATQWLDDRERNLTLVDRLHAAAEKAHPQTRDALQVLRFFAEHERVDYVFGQTFRFGRWVEYLVSYIESTSGVYQAGLTTPTRDMITRLKRKNDLGQEYPLLAALSEEAISAHLSRAAVLLDSVLTQR